MLALGKKIRKPRRVELLYQGTYLPPKKVRRFYDEEILRRNLSLITWGPKKSIKASLKHPRGRVLRIPAKERIFRKLSFNPEDFSRSEFMTKYAGQPMTVTLAELPDFDTLGITPAEAAMYESATVTDVIPEQSTTKGTWGNLESLLSTITSIASVRYQTKIEEAQAERAALQTIEFERAAGLRSYVSWKMAAALAALGIGGLIILKRR